MNKALVRIPALLAVVAFLARKGFADVQVVRGGMSAWLEHGWPVERNPQT